MSASSAARLARVHKKHARFAVRPASLACALLATALLLVPGVAGAKKHKFFKDPSVVDISGAVDTSPPQPNAFDLIGRVQASQRCQGGRTVIVHITSATGDAPVTTTTDSSGHWRATVHKPTPPFDLTAEVLALRKGKKGVCKADVGEDKIHYP